MFNFSDILIVKMRTTYISAVVSTFIFLSCSASTGSRYEKTVKDKDIVKESLPENHADKNEEDFNFVPYREDFGFEDKVIESKPVEKVEAWYGYDTNDSSTSVKNYTNKIWGYRVQVFATDNLEEANSARTDLYFKTNQKSIYVIFDPPFYKVKAGDFSNLEDANSLTFKLSQMGYTESRVVKDSINVFK